MAEILPHFAGAGLAGLKVDLQSLGVRLDFPASGYRRGGAGPAEGITLLLNGVPASVPTGSPFVRKSPYALEMRGEKLSLTSDGTPVEVTVTIPPAPNFYGLRTSGGMPQHKIALLHGAGCLASTVVQSCIHWGGIKGCRFCGIGLSLRNGSTVLRKTPGQLAETASSAVRLDGVDHVTLTSGALSGEDEIQHLAACAGAVKRAAGIPVHVQIMPPRRLSALEILRRGGVDTVGIHLESFDRGVLGRVAPAKLDIGVRGYLSAWREAVRVFGRGQVSSFILVGMGEDPEVTGEGCATLAELGVYPYLAPFRPIPGTPMAGARPPAPEKIYRLYRRVARQLRKHNLSAAASLAGCVRCGACSALPEVEKDGEIIGRTGLQPVPGESASALQPVAGNRGI